MKDLRQLNHSIQNTFSQIIGDLTRLPNEIELSYYVAPAVVESVEPVVAKTVIDRNSKTRIKRFMSTERPKKTTPILYKVNETVYEAVFDDGILKSDNLFKSFLKKFIIKCTKDFKSQVGLSPLIGTQLFSLDMPGYEGEFIEVLDSGEYRVRLYTDLTPKTTKGDSMPGCGSKGKSKGKGKNKGK